MPHRLWSREIRFRSGSTRGCRVSRRSSYLHVGGVAAEAEDAAVVEGAKVTEVSEAGEGAVPCYSNGHH